MRKALLMILMAVTFNSLCLAQKTINDTNAEKRTLSGFHGISVANGIELMLTKGSTQEVAVSASETKFRDKIVTEVVNGILKIHYETNTGSINRKNETKGLKAYVSYTTLDLLHVSTGAKVNIQEQLEATSLELQANTGGSVSGEVNVGSLKVDQSTGSKITLSGKSDKLDADGDTGSKFMGEALNTNTCNVKMSTGAGIYISVEKELYVKANTGGYIKYKGNAGIREIKTNSGGRISKI